MPDKILKRECFEEIKKFFYNDGIIVLHGARQVGKTHILYYTENYLKNKKEATYYIDLEDPRMLAVLNSGTEDFIKLLLAQGIITKNSKPSKKIFVLIDEIQYLSNPLSFLKLIADHHKNIKLIVSGSSSFEIKSKFKNSLVGRTIDFEIFPLSFSEFLVFKNKKIDFKYADLPLIIGDLKILFKEFALYGGYPGITLEPEITKKEKFLAQIIATYIKKDIRDLAEIKDIVKFNKLIETLAAQSGNLLNVNELANTVGLSKPTIEKHLFLLENTYIIKLVRPFSKNIRSELFKTPKIYFYDSGLAQMLWLKKIPEEIIGSIFETVVFGELTKKYGTENIHYWRTQDKKEIDFILNLKNSLLPIETKINFNQFNKTSINYFIEKYKLKNYKITALNGEKRNNCIYPWEL
jgi:hypothetical protein